MGVPHTSVPNFFKLPPDLYLGEGIGIATNSKGHIFIYHRSGDTRLFEFDPNGNYLKEWRQGVYGIEFAHQVRVDRDDSVWVVDEGTNMVVKFNPQGRVVMVLGAGRFGSAGKLPKEFSLVNSIDCRNDNELLIGELANWRVQKITLRAAK
jgi:streptogramin lyase